MWSIAKGAVIHAMISLLVNSVNNLHLQPSVLEKLFFRSTRKEQFNFGLMKTYHFSKMDALIWKLHS